MEIKATLMWNAILDHTKQSNTIPIFNGKLKTILIENGYCTFNV